MVIIKNYDCAECHVPVFIDNKKTNVCWKCLHPFECICRLRYATKEELKDHQPECANREYKANEKREYKLTSHVPTVKPKQKHFIGKRVLCACGSKVSFYYLKSHMKRKIHLDRMK